MTFIKSLASLLVLMLFAGCSDSSVGDQTPTLTPEQIAAETDRVCQEILKSSNNMVADSWLKRQPKTTLRKDAQGEPLYLSHVATKLKLAGASRVVVEYSGLNRDAVILSLVVVLPSDPGRRQNVFALEPELSSLCGQTPVSDLGQKYLNYRFH